MSLNIDLGTAALLAGMLGLLSSSLVYLTCRTLPAPCREIAGLWAFGLYLYGLAMLLVTSRNGTPVWVPSVLGNALLAYSTIPLALALRRFYGQSESGVLAFGLVVATISLLQHAWLLELRPDVNLRIAIGSICQALLIIPILSPLLRAPAARSDPGFWLAVGPFVLFALVLVQRALIFLHGAPMQNAFDMPGTQAFSYVVIVLVPVMAASGFSYLCVTRMQRELQHIATTDYLTDCLNRRAFELEGPVLIDRVRRTGARMCLLLLDLDHLKTINDVHGHAAGDAMLRKLGAVIASLLGEDDRLFRIGGDEFAVFIDDCSTRDPVLFGEEVNRMLRQRHPDRFASISVSIGSAFLEEGDDLHKLLLRADQAMYAQKAARG